MLPIYEAIGLSNAYLFGGTTRPLVFTVKAEDYDEYVVKVFKKKDIRQYNPTSKECYAYVLASEFSLEQPPAAIIQFNEDLLATIPAEVSKRIKDSGTLFHFGTKLMNGYSIMPSNFSLKDLHAYELESLFAFDIFIHNPDRRIGKPNLLVNGKDYLLIDHELSLPINEVTLQSIKEGDFSFLYNNDKLRRHIFAPHLKRLRKKGQLVFEDFDYHLSSLNVLKLNEIKKLLEKINVDTNDFEIIKQYISELKDKRKSFINSLNYFL